MATSRRALLGTGIAGGAALLVGCDDDTPSSASPTATAGATSSESPSSAAATEPFDPQDWASVRAQFPLDPSLAQFAAFVLSPHVAPVAAAIEEYRAQLSADTEAALVTGFGLEEEVRQEAARYTGARTGDLALTGSTTEGIALMYAGLPLAARDEVLTTTHDFFSTEEALRLAQRRTGVRITRTRLYDDPADPTVDEMVDRVLRGLTPRTRVVALTWVHSSTGVRVPVREIADALHGRDVLLCVDGVHGFAAVDVDLPDLGCDFLATGTHKWLFGPRGTGLLYARDWAPLQPMVPSFSGPGRGNAYSPGGYHAFEHRWAVAEAFRFHQAIGRGRVVGRTVDQATLLKQELADLDGITLVTPVDPDVSAGIVCLDVRGMRPPDAVHALRQQGVVASSTPYAVSYVRLGPSIATSPEQVELAREALATLV